MLQKLFRFIRQEPLAAVAIITIGAFVVDRFLELPDKEKVEVLRIAEKALDP